MTVDSTEAPTGRIFDIKKFAVHDGPGIRTTVFCKGCPLRCIWCHNPESLETTAELAISPDKCIGCGACVEACPAGALRIDEQGICECNRDLCTRCGKCAAGCFSGALEMIGREVTVEDVMAEVRKDAPFYKTSGGGVTISGGEPLIQGEFVTALLRQCRSEGFHTALDTSGHVPWETLTAAAAHADLVLYDLKHVDPGAHEKHTGASNDLIIDNLRRLGGCGVDIEIRMPIVPGLNDSARDIDAAGQFIRSLDNVVAVRLLAYHRLAAAKYARLGRDDPSRDIDPPDKDHIKQIAERLSGFSLTVFTEQG
ncbi:MAG: glycyl-radical enzyme activating protein [Phycisphaerae bacterium]|nr:glycyl-radical enzyme activating protein [Phycisphaerae bacterium]